MTLCHEQAREIASHWHGGQGSALYALASTGAIDQDAVTDELLDCRRLFTTDDDELQSLLDSIAHHGNRGPMVGWSSMNWEEDGA